MNVSGRHYQRQFGLHISRSLVLWVWKVVVLLLAFQVPFLSLMLQQPHIVCKTVCLKRIYATTSKVFWLCQQMQCTRGQEQTIQ